MQVYMYTEAYVCIYLYYVLHVCTYVHVLYMIVCVCGCTYFENDTHAGTCIAYMIVTKQFSANLIAVYGSSLKASSQ